MNDELKAFLKSLFLVRLFCGSKNFFGSSVPCSSVLLFIVYILFQYETTAFFPSPALPGGTMFLLVFHAHHPFSLFHFFNLFFSLVAGPCQEHSPTQANLLNQRKHIRLRNFDYASANAYFITVCVKQFVPSLGSIRNGICGLSEIGNDVALRLQNIPLFNTNVILDEFIVMPNHFHVLLIIDQHDASYVGNQFQKPRGGSVSMMINAAKGATTKWCQANHHCFEWQDKFYDHVVRNEQEYWAIKNYIINNPSNWKHDRFHL